VDGWPLNRIPYYYFIKLVVVTLLWYPGTKGAVIIKDRVEQVRRRIKR